MMISCSTEFSFIPCSQYWMILQKRNFVQIVLLSIIIYQRIYTDVLKFQWNGIHCISVNDQYVISILSKILVSHISDLSSD